MSRKEVTIIEGNVRRDPYGSFEDCSPGLYLDGENVEYLFNGYEGKKLRVTIEEIEE